MAGTPTVGSGIRDECEPRLRSMVYRRTGRQTDGQSSLGAEATRDQAAAEVTDTVFLQTRHTPHSLTPFALGKGRQGWRGGEERAPHRIHWVPQRDSGEGSLGAV